MIGRLSGRIADRGADQVLLDVGGVGYLVHVSERTLAALPDLGEAAQLWTELLVREDALQLVGFATLAEKEWHRLLMGVQGVGAKAAMAILGALGADGVARAIALGDWQAVRAAPGVGPKLAQRVVNELKDRAPTAMGAALPGAAPARRPEGPEAEAMSALANLGYAPAEAARAVAEVVQAGQGGDTPTLIREALKRLAPRG